MDMRNAYFRNLIKRNLILISIIVGSLVLLPVLGLLGIIVFGSSLRGAPSDNEFFYWYFIFLFIINLFLFNFFSFRSFSAKNLLLNSVEYVLSLVIIFLLLSLILGKGFSEPILSLFFAAG